MSYLKSNASRIKGIVSLFFLCTREASVYNGEQESFPWLFGFCQTYSDSI